LAVRDLSQSRAFYEKLGFEVVGGNPDQHWLILRNGSTTIGLFQGMFERNALTFNPGWSPTQETLAEFMDVRDIQAELERRGLTLTTRADPASDAPAHLALVDPDGNPLLIDQHVPRPKAP
jgi:catechol 2,3-dioxygenase-like lactoylglutathione lyase family enzyme